MIGAGAVLALPAGARRQSRLALVAGTYEAEGGKGLYRVEYDPARGDWSVGEPDGAIRNASYGVRSNRFGARYLLDEAGGMVGMWRANLTGARLASAATGGDGPCHIAIDAAQTCLAVANYGSGSVALFALDPRTGMPHAPPAVRVHGGHGPDAVRQQGPHAHWVGFAPGGGWLHSVDLGTDAVRSYALDAATGAIFEGHIACHAPPGSGPRHLAFHPHLPLAYLVCELGNTIITLATTPGGGFVETAITPTLPVGFTGKSYAGHIAVDRTGSRLYVSNRGHDSIAVHAIDPAGRLSLVEHVATGGSWPRFFLLCEDAGLLVVANERAGTIVTLAVAGDGRLKRAGAAARVPGVAFLDRA